MIKKVVVIGPESTGKTTLCKLLAQYFKTSRVPEYAREYLLKNGRDYQYEDLYTIAQGQLLAENQATENLVSNLAEQEYTLPFIDTDLYVIKVWSEFVFNNCDNRILSQIAVRHYDLYLLCNTDVEWIKDELREYPELSQRNKLFHFYKEALVSQKTAWIEISGNYQARLQQAIAAVQKLMGN